MSVPSTRLDVLLFPFKHNLTGATFKIVSLHGWLFVGLVVFLFDCLLACLLA